MHSLCLLTTPTDNAELRCCSLHCRHYFPEGTSAQEERFALALHGLDRFSPAALEAKCAEADDVDHLIDLLLAAASPGIEQVPTSEQVPSPSDCTAGVSLQRTEDSADKQILGCASQSQSSSPVKQSMWLAGSVAALVGRLVRSG